ncbi:hypothetical protein [Flavobacterium sp.]|uniref:hypothetical protein n=1 Tax=Flavobacterium sp. TaxID=239 RepID=UPI0025C5DF07|nr:hypothetical protein [Flavobacterium sp.]MBA4276096.1 hypothetical protein [Flavobacterium sp.]
MKKIITLLAVVGMFSVQSCTTTTDTNYVDNDTIAEVFELKNINFAYNATDGYTIYQKFTPNIYASDVVLIYRLSGTIDSNTPVWQLIPRTLFLNQGELDYDFDFSKEDFTIYAGGNYDLSLTPQYLNNQTFRIVIVPGSFSASFDTSNYAAVISALNINESQIQKINF